MSRNLQFTCQLHNTLAQSYVLHFFESLTASNTGLYRYQQEVNKKLKQQYKVFRIK